MARPGSKLRTAVLFAFGGLLSLLLIAGWEALSSVRKIHADEEAARRAFLARNECILTVRSTLDVYGNRVQQYFLSYRSGVRASAAHEFPALFGRIHSELAKYPSDRKPEEQSMLARGGTIGTLAMAVAKRGKAATSPPSPREIRRGTGD
ncbi:MAG: hypothetical protein ACR2I2_14655 [Bryobacteraceae bacterium]